MHALDELVYECADARGKDGISLRPVIPVSDRPIAMLEEKVPVQVCTDDVDLLPAPPWSVERTMVRRPK